MYWFWTCYLSTSLLSQLSVSSLSAAIRAFLAVGRVAAAPVYRRLRARATRRAARPPVRPPLFLITEDFEYMVLTLARKQWKRRLAFVDRNSKVTLKLCSLTRGDDGVLRWAEQVKKSLALDALLEASALVASIQSGVLVLSGNAVALVSLARNSGNKELKASKKQTTSARFDATCCATHVGHDTLAAIGSDSPALAIFRNRHNSWSLVNTGLPVTTVNSALAHLGDNLYHFNGRCVISGEISPAVHCLKMAPANLPLAVRLATFQAARWQRCADCPVPREKFCAVALNSAVALLGGVDCAGRALDAVTLYNPATDEWVVGPPLKHARFDFSCVQVGNYLLAFNGFGVDGTAEPNLEAIHMNHLLQMLVAGCEDSADEEREPSDHRSDSPWIQLGPRTDLINCKVVLASDEASEPSTRVRHPVKGSSEFSVVRPIALTSDSEHFDELPVADDPFSWFYA